MSEIEIPGETLAQAVHDLYAAGPWGEFDRFLDGGVSCSTDAHAPKVYEAMVREVYPSIRCQVLESVVEDVAKALESEGDSAASFAKTIDPYWIDRARRLLGLEGEG